MERRRRGFEAGPTRLPQLQPALAADKRRREGGRKTQRRAFNFHRSAEPIASCSDSLSSRMCSRSHTARARFGSERSRRMEKENSTRCAPRALGWALRFAGASSRAPPHRSVRPAPPCRESRVLTRGQQINPRQRPHAATATLRPTAAAEETRIASTRPPRQSSAHPAHPAIKKRGRCVRYAAVHVRERLSVCGVYPYLCSNRLPHGAEGSLDAGGRSRRSLARHRCRLAQRTRGR